jgi:site-specific recombinase XerD
MKKTNTATMDPLIEGYFSYLDKVGRKAPRTIVDVRCTLRRAIAGLERVRPGVTLWHLKLEDYLHWLEAERQCGSTASSLAKYLSHVRGLLEYTWRSGRAERNVLDGFSLQHTVRRTVLGLRLHSALGYRSPEEFEQQIEASGSAESRSATMVFFENKENSKKINTGLLGKGTQVPSPSPDPFSC